MNAFLTNKWNNYLNIINPLDKDVYFTEEYVNLYSDIAHEPLCAICVDNENILLLPILKSKYKDFFDFETPYGYGGPITNSHDQNWIDFALKSIFDLFKNEKFLCGFLRMHPLIDNANFCNRYIDIIYDRQTIYIDTSISDIDIWNTQISSKNRNVIRKAEKNGLIFTAEYDFKSIDTFIKLYNETMNRLNADKFYFFDNDYFYKFIEGQKKHSFLGVITKEKEVCCAAIFMYNNLYGHYHLEASNSKFSSLGANNYLLWMAANELKKNGVIKFHLGGGTNSDENNSLFKFKKAFSKNICDFKIGKWIFDNDKYNIIKNDWIKNNDINKINMYKNHLLCYRY